MVVRTSRRLPGFRFEVQPPPLAEVLPRMDLAVFVGFASAGPLHTPVVVEDVAHFTALFGDDLPLAWDQQRGEQVYAYLAPAVRAFFRNGGRRCWVVRVAGEAVSNFFPIPGLAQAQLDADGLVLEIAPAFAQARSEGSWSDTLLVGSALLSDPASIVDIALETGSVTLTLAGSNLPVVGDLLRLTFVDAGYIAFVPVTEVLPIIAGGVGLPASAMPPGQAVGQARVSGGTALWFSTDPVVSPLPVPLQAVLFTHSAPSAPITILNYEFSLPDGIQGVTVTLDLDLTPANAPMPGTLLRVNCDSGQLWLTVQEVRLQAGTGSPPAETVQVSGQGLWWLNNPPDSWLLSPPGQINAERMTFELWVRQGDASPTRVSDLGLTPGHPRFWGALPTDQQLYLTGAVPSTNLYAALWESVADPRFPLAGQGASGIAFPLAMPFVPDQWLGSDRVTGLPLERDGLAAFSASLFLDPALIEARTEDVMAQADFLRYESLAPRQLTGIHAALGLEEATIIAVPDAVHRGWFQTGQSDPPAPPPSAPLPHPEWWRFLDCDPPPALPLTQTPQWGNFLDCGLRMLTPPTLDKSSDPDQPERLTLFWTTPDGPDVSYILEEATAPDFSGAVSIYTGSADHLELYGRSPGDYSYRVRAVAGALSSNWSNGVAVRVAQPGLWQLNGRENYSAETLLAVQRALLRMCAARGDLLAVLTLPEHYREDDALRHVTSLTTLSGNPLFVDLGGGQTAALETLGYGEARAFSYGALYHPWLIGPEGDQSPSLRNTPPDGAMCGVLAQRALTRGAWIAPANEVLQGPVALTPTIASARWLDLQTAQVNLVRQEPRGFLTLSADTLSADADLRPINVRRLLILLRRLALRLGATYVFEPNSDAFRRMVQRGFEAMLGDMNVRGAFAGDTPDTSFQVVVTGASLNTPQSVDQGRFIVELRVAPSLPMTFLTIRLVQSGDQRSVTEVS